MTKNIFSLSLAIGLLFGAISAQATEQEHLAQAIKQLDAAKLSLQRAAASAKVLRKAVNILITLQHIRILLRYRQGLSNILTLPGQSLEILKLFVT